MTTALALLILIALFGSVWALLERNHRRVGGSDAVFGHDRDGQRVLHDLHHA